MRKLFSVILHMKEREREREKERERERERERDFLLDNNMQIRKM